jgi:hypothetical protein
MKRTTTWNALDELILDFSMRSTSSFLIFSICDAGIVQTLPRSVEDTSSRCSLFRQAGTLDADILVRTMIRGGRGKYDSVQLFCLKGQFRNFKFEDIGIFGSLS